MAAFLKRLFQKAPIPKEPDGNEIISIACGLLATQINLGSASPPDGVNRRRLEMPFARGYVFGFIDALVQKGRISDETHALALISVAHAKIFGKAMGAVFIADALASQSPDSSFSKGRAAGAADVIGWFGDKGVLPLGLSDYLNSATEP